jgi:putative addiction module component (TIGR02574 family)
MTTTAQSLAAQANELSAQERSHLIDLLVATLPEEEDAEVEAAWEKEIRRRVAEIEAGTAKLIPSEEVHAKARRILGR